MSDESPTGASASIEELLDRANAQSARAAVHAQTARELKRAAIKVQREARRSERRVALEAKWAAKQSLAASARAREREAKLAAREAERVSRRAAREAERTAKRAAAREIRIQLVSATVAAGAGQALTVRHLMARWQTARNEVIRAINDGRLKAFKLGARKYRVTLDEVIRFESQAGA